ncbi:MAG: hypothetical protein ACYDA3_10890 [Gaiellaceae bacterium]
MPLSPRPAESYLWALVGVEVGIVVMSPIAKTHSAFVPSVARKKYAISISIVLAPLPGRA